ncbi:MAG: hypothetical protein QN649_10080 [Nitrososphaeraceae archaeon]|nr:hypothetical protein [Nitrososphaeraceae archaeon]
MTHSSNMNIIHNDKDTVEIAYNPFGIGTSFLGIDSRTSIGGKDARKKKERQKHL